MSTDGPIPRREVAYRLFAAEYDDADLEYSDSDEERAPNYVVTPSGARVNRLFAVGVLTAVEPVSDDVLRARVVDPTGAFVVYAGQYQPDAVGFLETADVPSFVAVTGKARTFQPEDSERVFTSIRPESMTAVGATTRDRWTVQAAEHTLARVATMARALERDERGDELARVLESSGVEPGLAAGTALAIDHYGTTRAYLSALRELAVAATEVVVGDRESVPELELAPDGDGPVATDLTAAPAVAGTLTDDLGEPVAAEPAAGGGDATHPPEAPAAEPELDAAAPEEPPPSAEEPTEEDGTAESGPADGLGEFATSEVVATDEPYDLDADERAAVEEEFGTAFSTGSEVGEPGEAGLETETEPPATEAPAPADEGSDADAASETDDDSSPAEPVTADETPSGDDESLGEAASAPDAEAQEPTDEAPVDLEDAAVETMAELDDGDGAPHDAVVDAVVDAHDVDPAAVEDAIQEALMGGRCYEPTDGRLKAI